MSKRFPLFLCIVALLGGCATRDTVPLGKSAQSTYLLNGTVVAPHRVIDSGWVLVQNGRIAGVSTIRPAVPASVPTILTNDFIFPGFIDLHNHPLYNVFPRWQPPKHYPNRYEWRSKSPEYANAIRIPNSQLGNYFCERGQFAEVQAISGGTTTFIGISRRPPIPACIIGLVRNLDLYSGFYGTQPGGEPIRNELGVERDMKDEDAEELRDKLAKKQIDLLVIHVAEGKRMDSQSQTEFQLLETKGLLTSRTAVVHGIALSKGEFTRMRDANASLIWSPRSNVELYGETVDIVQASKAGVRIALAPDWAPSGSVNMLAELKYAYSYNKKELGSFFTAKQLFEMATSIPADIANISDKVGRIAPGLYADLFLLRRTAVDPYETLMQARPEDVTLVMADGVPIYGTAEHLTNLGVARVEDIRLCSEQRRLNTEALPQVTFAEISERLSKALKQLGTQLGGLAECTP